jgi:hypothetical protein
MRESVAANAPVIVTVSGTAPMPASPQGSGGVGAASGGAGGGAQDPSVNSRAEAAGDATTVTATTIPARLDSLKWILVGGFAAIFALGFVFLLRRPQMAAVSAAGMAATAFDETGVPRNASPIAAKAAGPSGGAADKSAAGSTAADMEREVRFSLDELKDSLFRLELRRQAGTIGEDEYARERQRIDATLRNLVRG